MTNIEVQYITEVLKEANELRGGYMILINGTVFSLFEDYCAKRELEFQAELEIAMLEFMSNHQ